MVYRVVLQGFTDADRHALSSFLEACGHRHPGYAPVQAEAASDIVVADGDSPDVVARFAKTPDLATTLFLGTTSPPAAIWHVHRPIQPALLLQRLDEMVAHLGAGSVVGRALATDGGHARVKAAAQRASRRARRAAEARSAGEPPLPTDVLVLDSNDGDRDSLCALLEHFGFCPYPARTGTQAEWLLDARHFTAVFLDVPLDHEAAEPGIGLCLRVKDNSRLSDGRPSALFLVVETASPADRVRAALAGGDALLVKPLGRGAVVGALESCGIGLPADERQP